MCRAKARAHCSSGAHQGQQTDGAFIIREGAELKREGGQGEAIVSGFLAGAEVKGAERK